MKKITSSSNKAIALWQTVNNIRHEKRSFDEIGNEVSGM